MAFFLSILVDVGCGLSPLDVFCGLFPASECPKFTQGGFLPLPPPLLLPPLLALFAVVAVVCPVWDVFLVADVFVAHWNLHFVEVEVLRLSFVELLVRDCLDFSDLSAVCQLALAVLCIFASLQLHQLVLLGSSCCCVPFGFLLRNDR